MRRSVKWISGVTALIVACALMGDGVVWKPVSNEFMKEIKPYGPGDFRIRDGRIIAMKLANPEIKFRRKTEAELNDPDSRAEVTEPWMDDVHERANRRSISILKGAVGGSIERVFHQRAQYGDWWLSPDWNTIYVASRWQDRRIKPLPGRELLPVQKLWKSVDGGEQWQRLTWPERHNITFLRFLDAQRGYLIGWGPRIWRTGDGGEHWTEVDVPELARNPGNPRQQFDLVALGADGVLRVAFFAAQYHDIENASLVFALPWGAHTPELAFTVPGQTVVDLLSSPDGKVHVLGWDGLPIDYDIPGDSERARPSVVSVWDGGKLRRLHEFDANLTGYALYRTPSGHLLFDGISDGLLPDDVTALSTDGGENWDVDNEGSSAQGGYYDTGTGTRWRASGYSLSRRAIP